MPGDNVSLVIEADHAGGDGEGACASRFAKAATRKSRHHQRDCDISSHRKKSSRPAACRQFFSSRTAGRGWREPIVIGKRKNTHSAEAAYDYRASWMQSTGEIVETAIAHRGRKSRARFHCPRSRTNTACCAPRTCGQEARAEQFEIRTHKRLLDDACWIRHRKP